MTKRRQTGRRWLMATVAVGAGVGVHGVAFAQAVTPSDTGQIEEIVVTARKREENLQDTPIAITAVSAAAIKAKGITNITEIASSTPSLTLQGSAPLSGNPSAAVVFVRGIGQIDFTINTDPGVGIYLDGVYVARSAGAVLDLVDVERVEVLRGPQGTLFGRNTIGGALSIVSKAPAAEFGGDVTATIGSDDRRQLQASVDVPLSDQLLTKFSGFYHRRDGYVTRLQTGEKLGGDDALAGRFQAEWKPNDRFTALFSVDGTRKREASAPNVALKLDGTAFPLGFLENSVVIGGGCAAAPNASRNCFGAAWETKDPYTSNGTAPSRSDLDIWGTSLTLNWDLGAVGLKSITAYREVQASFARDTDHTPYNFLYSDISEDQDQFSQELQVTGRAFDDRLKWLGGVYYFKESAFENYQSSGDVNGVQGLNHTRNSNYAVFGEGTYDLTDKLHLTAGLRYTSETKKFRTDQQVIAGVRSPIGTLIVVDDTWQSQTSEETSPRITVSYDLASALMAYATYSKGFKSGGFNARYSSPVAKPISFSPEFATLYEAGLKYETPQRNLRLNLAAFHTDYTDVQVDFSYPGVLGTLVGNAGAAKIDGAELEFTYIPLRRLHIDGSVSYLDARYTEVDATVPSISAGNSLPFVPKWSASLSASYAIDLGDKGTLTPRIDYSYRSHVFFTSSNNAIASQKSYPLLNAAIAYETVDGVWRATLGGRNLTDERFLTSSGYSDSAGVWEGVYARPREWYLSLDRKF
ncbi:TonB-dependent receptor [Caulobacter soli]|uniref:TonB-dependent receptor n=1 Tax=Caulobacter soli TaxID=2708539 RepID=UPI0013EAD63A|nr:TonB-dependent receptor [Caulobacter soli]